MKTIINIKQIKENIRLDGTMVKLSKIDNNILNLFKTHGFRMVSAVFPGDVSYDSRLNHLYSFAGYLHQMYLHHGEKQVIQYLKVGQLCIQKCIAGNPVSSMKSDSAYPHPRLAHGLPVFIPVVDRGLIRAGHPAVIRFWLTAFSVYRVIEIPGELKLNTITDGPSYDERALQDIADLISERWDPSMLDKRILTRNPELLLLESASAGYPVAMWDYFHSAYSLSEKGLFSEIEQMCQLLGYTKFLETIRVILSDDRLATTMKAKVGEEGILAQMNLGKPVFGNLGRLSAKDEPAGKVRLFAMVDPITQCVFKPLHDTIFQLLGSLPNDAMKDQQLAVERAMKKALRAGKAFAFDLSAATDRLPIRLQIAILNKLFKGLGDLWAKILVDRDFTFRHKVYTSDEVITVRYSTGQPMGAYSSWAMLDLTHHLIVQVAALRAGKIQSISLSEWFEDYEMLGDDVVIFDEEVANHYLQIMKDLGVPINMGKSVVAKNATFEFAKVTGHKGHFVSALSWKAFMSQDSMMGRANIVYSLVNKKIIFKNITKWVLNVTRQSRWQAGNPAPTLLALITMVANSGFISVEAVLRSLSSVREPLKRWYSSILLNIDVNMYKHLLGRLLLREEGTELPVSQVRNHLWDFDKPWAMMALWKPLEVFKYKAGDGREHALNLAKQFVLANNPAWHGTDVLDHLSLETIEFFQEDWTSHQQDAWVLLYPIYTLFLDKLTRFTRFFPELEGSWINPTFESLYKWNQEMERYNELVDIFNRLQLKMDKAPNKKVVRSPLSMIQFFVRMNHKRPGWTYAKLET